MPSNCNISHIKHHILDIVMDGTTKSILDVCVMSCNFCVGKTTFSCSDCYMLFRLDMCVCAKECRCTTQSLKYKLMLQKIIYKKEETVCTSDYMG
jgi:hypothetical protein